MATSPYIPQDIKGYIKNYSLQKIVNDSVNNLLKLRPDDPYAFMIGQFQKLASSQIIFKSVKGYQNITGQGFPAIKVKVNCIYMNKQISFFINQPLGILSQENMIYDEDRHNGKGQNKGIQFLENTLSSSISGLKCSQQSQIDNRLQKSFQSNQSKGLYQINTLSYLQSLIQSHVLSIPLYKIFSNLGQQDVSQQKSINVMINCLHGGKIIGSKCKVFKYYLIGQNIKDPWIIQNVLQAIRKNIVSGKGGQAALKLSPDGTFICPVDTIMDNLKIVEDAINSCNAKDHFSIGLSWMAETLFNPDTKKYQLQNPKTPFDNDQMIDYLLKLLADKPIIQYLQDPLAPTQKAAWKKLITKIRQAQALKKVKIGTRSGKLINLKQENLKQQISQISIPINSQTKPDFTQQQIKQANQNKFTIDYVQCRAFQLKTLSKVLTAKKNLSKIKTKLILQDNSFETYDTSIIDLCVGLKCFANLGSINKYDRICKLNRISEIIHQK